MIDPDLRIGVVGATGAVGRVTLQYLADRGYTRIRTFASSRSAGERLGEFEVEEATERSLGAGDLDVCFFSVGTRWSRELVPAGGDRRRALRGQVGRVSAHRTGVPLVVPEVNGERALEHTGIVANPNCCTIPLTMVLAPLRDAVGLRERARRHVPVGVGRGLGRDRRSARRDPRRPPPAHGLGLRRRRVRRGGRSSAEETRKILELPGAAGERDVRSRPRRRRPRRGGLGRDRGTARRRGRRASPLRRAGRARRGRPGARPGDRNGRRASSVAFAATRPPRTASSSSSCATTCARAPR